MYPQVGFHTAVFLARVHHMGKQRQQGLQGKPMESPGSRPLTRAARRRSVILSLEARDVGPFVPPP
jgi:hypothetical protein